MIRSWGHVAVARRSERESDLFFVDLLGLERTRARDLAPELAGRIFGREVACRMVDYERGGIRFEVFVPADGQLGESGFGHVCLAVEDREELLARCDGYDPRVIRVLREGGDIVFLEDRDGNLYEIQEARPPADRASS